MKKIVIAVLLLIFLTGCGARKSEQTPPSAQTPAAWESRIDKVVEDHLIVKADVNFVKRETYRIYEAYRHEFTVDELIEMFDLADEHPEIAYAYEDTGGFGIKTGGKYVDYAGTLYYTLNHYRSNYGVALQDTSFTFKMAEHFEEELPPLEKFQSEYDDAKEQTLRIMKKAGINTSEEPRVKFYVPADVLERSVHKRFTDQGEDTINPRLGIQEDWSGLPGCIYMIWDVYIDDIPILSGNYSADSVTGTSNTESGSSVIACFAEKELQGMDIIGAYDIMESTEEAASLISPGEAVESLKYYYRNILLTSDANFYKIDLNYVPRLVDYGKRRFLMVPAWVFCGVQTVGEGSMQTDKTFVIKVNAVTGEVMY